MVSADPVKYFLDIKDLKDKGYEIVVSIVNEGEDWLYVKRAQVDIDKDGKSFGRHEVSFPNTDRAGMVRLGQFESAEGHFHIKDGIAHKTMDFKVLIDYRYGEHNDTQKIAKRVDTQRITRKG
jgi:hypothetical protein